jgi:hypothetical protein
MDLIHNKIQFKIRNSIGERHYQVGLKYPEGLSQFVVYPTPTFSMLANPIMMQQIDPELILSLQIIGAFSIRTHRPIRDEYKKLYK